jgi:coenzyme F420-0:L-glutamate ligase/coenzyme F420-1:gamma-L-glutamate ligase
VTGVQEDSSSEGAVQILPIAGIPEIHAGDPIAAIITDAIATSIGSLRANDIVVVTHKVVSKAEGKLVSLSTIEPSALATRIGTDYGKDARQVEVVLREARRIIRMVNGLIIAETRHGFVCANAGVDASNVAPDVVCLLPDDPDASADGIRTALTERFFAESSPGDRPIGVIVTDSFGRPWRNGIVNVAIGVSGIAPLADYRGQQDSAGYELHASVLAVADEIASAAELVMHKLAARPVAVIRGYEWQASPRAESARDLVMPDERNLFR